MLAHSPPAVATEYRSTAAKQIYIYIGGGCELKKICVYTHTHQRVEKKAQSYASSLSKADIYIELYVRVHAIYGRAHYTFVMAGEESYACVKLPIHMDTSGHIDV